MDKSTDRVAQSLYDETIIGDGQSRQAEPVNVSVDEPIRDTERIELRAERFAIDKRYVEGRRAIITRRVVSVRKTIEVDLLHEELQIDYEPGSGTEIVGEQPETIVVRLRAEEVELIKHVRVVEEVLLSKRRATQTVPIEVELKHEELSVLKQSV